MAKPIQKVFIENFTKTMLHVYVDDKHLTITNAHKLTKINGVSICQVNLTEMNFTVILNPIYDKMEMIAEVTRFCEQEFYDD